MRDGALERAPKAAHSLWLGAVSISPDVTDCLLLLDFFPGSVDRVSLGRFARPISDRGVSHETQTFQVQSCFSGTSLFQRWLGRVPRWVIAEICASARYRTDSDRGC